MVVNDNAGSLTPSSVLESIASMLAPTGFLTHPDPLSKRQAPTPCLPFLFQSLKRTTECPASPKPIGYVQDATRKPVVSIS
ncbi:hypothetical protein DKY63_18345 [Pseudomonas putida]|uniref:Uncharacterized protein n=1 Tax=Pseudomonas putida TaxID=303 RepID=A0A2Z4RLD6_PSEPU|nr:hypothetical protein DKY63_18345 [Pseudomonas putida]